MYWLAFCWCLLFRYVSIVYFETNPAEAHGAALRDWGRVSILLSIVAALTYGLVRLLSHAQK
jgi:hypothetical protein